jgi:hypothetical protein
MPKLEKEGEKKQQKLPTNIHHEYRQNSSTEY